MRKKEEPKDEQVTEAAISRRPTASRSESSFWTPKRRSTDSYSKEDTPLPPLPTSSDGGRKASAEVVPGHRAPPSRSNTFDFWPTRKTEEPEEISTNHRPSPSKAVSESDLTPARPRPRGNTVDGKRENCSFFPPSHKAHLNGIRGHDRHSSPCLASQCMLCARVHHQRTSKSHEHYQCNLDHGWNHSCNPCHQRWRWGRRTGFTCGPSNRSYRSGPRSGSE